MKSDPEQGHYELLSQRNPGADEKREYLRYFMALFTRSPAKSMAASRGVTFRFCES
ncbi:MAG: hypothetical protein HGB36_06470 [Chlorobiaceae bacterium]|nr:hypothetical protein [Chlorobiaceae bacterium]